MNNLSAPTADRANPQASASPPGLSRATMPERPVPRLESVVWSGSEPRTASLAHERMCTHWPLDGASQMLNASHALLVMADRLVTAGSPPAPARPTGCIDLHALAREPLGDALSSSIVSVPAELQAHKLALRALADDFEKISVWLARAAESSWDAAKALRQRLGLAGVLGEDQRMIAKDWLAADMNALIATLLRRAVGVLDRVDLTPNAAKADAAGQGSHVPFVRLAAEILQRAAALATQAALFVEEFDKRWHLFRQQVAVAISPDAVNCPRPIP